jgi:hypothetical protein
MQRIRKRVSRTAASSFRDADVVALGRQQAADDIGVAREEAHEHARPTIEKRRDQVREQRNGGARMAGDDEPTHLRGADLLSGLRQPVDTRQRLVGLGVEQHALGRRLQSTVAAIE